METFTLPHKKKVAILALGAESAGNFSVFNNGKIFFSEDFGDLLEENNWKKYQKEVLRYLKNNKIKPQIILTDLHPLYKTTAWGKELAKKFDAKCIPIQHHIAHIFSAIGDSLLETPGVLKFRHRVSKCFYGVAMDGTGFGTDEKIWGGEVFEVESRKHKVESIKRIGHLENQIMIGGDLAVREPARMLIGVLYKTFCHPERSPYSDEVEGSITKYHQQYQKADSSTTLCSAQNDTEKKNCIYPFIKKYYTKNEFELIYNQLSQNFNCQETSSTGRVLDAVSFLLGFCENKRNYKHEPIDLLEKNSTIPYSNLKPKIIFDNEEKKYILLTIPLFEYLIKNIKKDKGRLATTAQIYIAQGLYEIINKIQGTRNKKQNEIFISGGLANNKIISKYFISKGAYVSKITPRGDAGLSFGQIVYYLLS